MSYSHACDRCSEPHAGDDTDEAFTLLPRLPNDTRAAIISSDLRPALPRIWRPLSDLLARASYGLQSTTLEILAGSLVRYEDARSALEKLGAVGQDTGLKTQTWNQKHTT